MCEPAFLNCSASGAGDRHVCINLAEQIGLHFQDGGDEGDNDGGIDICITPTLQILSYSSMSVR